MRGLFALCVIGLHNSDIILIDAALIAMVVHKQDPRHDNDIQKYSFKHFKVVLHNYNLFIN